VENRKLGAPLKELAHLFSSQRHTKEMEEFLEDILTRREQKEILERWYIVKALLKGGTQREVKEQLKVSISKVSRGAQVLKYGRGAFLRIFNRLKKGR